MMNDKRLKLLRVTLHPGSNWPYMRAECCGSRVNFCEGIKKLAKPDVYGAGTDSPIKVTHTEVNHCKCGKVRLVVEGTARSMVTRGCFLVEEK